MKKITLFLAFIAFASASFSQDCPTSLRRTNSNGVCGGLGGMIILSYAVCPTSVDFIDSVWVNGVKYDVTFGDPTACTGPQHQITYCLLSGNMPPTGFWRIFFHNITVVSGFNCLVPEPGGGPLPINLTGFYAKRATNTVAINWQTSYEYNAQNFVIQRKTGNDWTTVGVVNATNSAYGHSYNFTDNNNTKDISQYRLKMVDMDDNFKNSEIRTVKGIGMISDFTVFPNPSTGDARVTISDITEGTEVEVLDNMGRMVKKVSMENTNTIEFNNLQKGMYMIRIENKNSGESVTKKLTVIN